VSKAIIKLDKVCKYYYLGEEEVRAVEDASVDIRENEYVGILGSSGSGKSTLMYLIGLLEQPTSGKVLLDDRDVSKLSDTQLSKIRNRHVGFVFQQFNLINKYTVLENVMLPSRYVRGQLDFDPQGRAEELLEKFGIWERRHFFPNKISGGQQQRVAIVRALMMKPKIVLADEPTGNIDSKTGKEIMDLIGAMNREFEVTVVVVTHDPAVAKRTKRQIYIKDGKIVGKYL
jgi:putative ABC transport system ATP-binding protein